MSPHYEDAAHLLRFLLARGMNLQPWVSYHSVIAYIADFVDKMHAAPGSTHADYADKLLGGLVCVAWDECPDLPKLRAITATALGNMLTGRK